MIKVNLEYFFEKYKKARLILVSNEGYFTFFRDFNNLEELSNFIFDNNYTLTEHILTTIRNHNMFVDYLITFGDIKICLNKTIVCKKGSEKKISFKESKKRIQELKEQLKAINFIQDVNNLNNYIPMHLEISNTSEFIRFETNLVGDKILSSNTSKDKNREIL